MVLWDLATQDYQKALPDLDYLDFLMVRLDPVLHQNQENQTDPLGLVSQDFRLDLEDQQALEVPQFR